MANFSLIQWFVDQGSNVKCIAKKCQFLLDTPEIPHNEVVRKGFESNDDYTIGMHELLTNLKYQISRLRLIIDTGGFLETDMANFGKNVHLQTE